MVELILNNYSITARVGLVQPNDVSGAFVIQLTILGCSS